MTNHITRQEWVEYLSPARYTQDHLQLVARVHAHIGACEECRALHASAIQMKKALEAAEETEAIAPTSSSTVVPISSAYRAVASLDMDDDDEDFAEAGNMITIPFEITADGAFFKGAQMLMTGAAEQFEFLPKANTAVLADDFDDSARMEFTADALIISLPETGYAITASISNADGTTELPPFDAEGTLRTALPAAGRYVLSIAMTQP